jgi:hypothetical protein
MRSRWVQYGAASFLFLEAVWAVWVVFRASEGGMSLVAYLFYFYGGLLFGLGFALWAILTLISAVIHRGPLRKVMLSRALLTQAVVLSAVFFAVSFGIGFRARLAMSEPALRTLALRTVEGTRSDAVQWVGLFRVRETDAVGGAVRFITAACGLDDCGVAYKQDGPPPRVGEDSYRDMGAGWWHWHRSW